MTLTILNVFENAEYNLNSDLIFQIHLGKTQLRNAIKQLNDNPNAMLDFDKKYLG